LSASRAALAGIAILLFLLLFSNPRVIIAASLVAVALLTLGGPVSKALDDTQTRGTTTKDSGFAEERAYDRLWRFKEHLVIGAGEGDFKRFDTRKDAREIHSSFATLWFSYGIIGVTLFFLFVARVIRGAPLRLTVMLVPTLAYTVAHQGLRFTLLWIMLAVFMALKEQAPAPATSPGSLLPAVQPSPVPS
jgi:hypothetical protein